jgi:hypothetical protein
LDTAIYSALVSEVQGSGVDGVDPRERKQSKVIEELPTGTCRDILKAAGIRVQER